MIQTDRLEFRHRGGFVLGPVSLSLGPGRHHLRGGNGSGKTTLMRLLCGDLAPRRGTVSICGGDPRDHLARRAVAWMPAECDLPPFLSVEEAWRAAAALRSRPDWEGRAIQDALKLPGSLLIARASAGQRQKAALLAALAGDPGVLLLDEPLANLDAAAVQAVAGLLSDESCILITAHVPPPLRIDSTAEFLPGEPLIWRAKRAPGEKS